MDEGSLLFSSNQTECQHDLEVLTVMLQLRQAISQERPDMQKIEKMLEKLPISVDHLCYSFVMSPMELACTTGNLDLVRLLLHHGADVHGRQRNAHSLYWQPLHLACGEGESDSILQIVQLLVHHGADINAYNGDGEQPLHLACNSNNLDVVKFLLSHGADVNCSGPHWYGKTPLLLACSVPDWEISPDIVRVLLEHGADVHAVTASGLDCLTNACVELSVLKVMMLLAWGARVKSSGPGMFRTVFEKVQPDEDQIPALFTIISLLLAAGATLDSKFVLKFVLQGNPALHAVKDKILNFLGKRLVEPVCLKSLCRMVIRGCLQQNINAKLEHLGLPHIVEDYLKFEDIISGTTRSICS